MEYDYKVSSNTNNRSMNFIKIIKQPENKVEWIGSPVIVLAGKPVRIIVAY